MHRAVTVVLALSFLLAASPAAAAPNVVVIETDDQTVSDLASMPHTRALIGDRGVAFANSFVSLSQCCPSRATFLTGQYAHNHGVRSVEPPYAFENLDVRETLPVWLQRAGYATGLVGKYLNGFGTRPPFGVPPGWTDFEALMSGTAYTFYDYEIDDDDRLYFYDDAPADYQTDVLTDRSVAFIRRRAGARPFFLWTTYVAPHTGRPRDFGDPDLLDSAVPAPRHRSAFFAALMPRPASFDEADVSDKPRAIRRLPRVRRELVAIQETWRQRQASLLAVDEGVTRIVAALARERELADSLLVFTSDNGFVLGEHRVPFGKVLAYEPSIRVPLLMRGPGIPAGRTRPQPVWNGDLAPTILDAAGARAPFALDGRSVLPFTRSARGGEERAILLEAPPARGTIGMPRFTGLRTPRYKYVEHVFGEVELYDLARDPDELENLAGTPGMAVVQHRLALRLARLRGCAGVTCR